MLHDRFGTGGVYKGYEASARVDKFFGMIFREHSGLLAGVIGSIIVSMLDLLYDDYGVRHIQPDPNI
jgi:hypothetical protein